MNVYFDNAATTQLDPRVLDAMLPYMQNHFGNPSSIHKHGREVKAAIENSRNKIAEILGASPGEIFFTSGGTEADNTFLVNTVLEKKIKIAITSKIEHQAVLHTLEELQSRGLLNVHYVNLNDKGHIDYQHLDILLFEHPKSLVSLMHGNNEIANLTDIKIIGSICNKYDAIFHSDTVQTIGHFRHNLSSFYIHSIVGSAHKFHGPKGVGFLYLNNTHKIPPYIMGGAQERNMRGGTENVHGIIGLAKALEIATHEMENNKQHIEALKSRMMELLQKNIDKVLFTGDSSNMNKSLYHVLNVALPNIEDKQMFLFNLDINNISVSAGSACSSGSDKGSHVIQEINLPEMYNTIRLSFSKLNTTEEIEYVAKKIIKLQKTN